MITHFLIYQHFLTWRWSLWQLFNHVHICRQWVVKIKMAEAVKHKLGTNHHNFRGIGLKPRKMAEAVKHNLDINQLYGRRRWAQIGHKPPKGQRQLNSNWMPASKKVDADEHNLDMKVIAAREIVTTSVWFGKKRTRFHLSFNYVLNPEIKFDKNGSVISKRCSNNFL